MRENIVYAENDARKVVLHLKEEQISYYAKMSGKVDCFSQNHLRYFLRRNSIYADTKALYFCFAIKIASPFFIHFTH